MFGPKLTNVFRSRWHALLWAGFVMLTAYCSVPSQDEQGAGDAEQIAALVAASQNHDAKPAQHANPWAKDAK
jgi:hypothetical protein